MSAPIPIPGRGDAAADTSAEPLSSSAPDSLLSPDSASGPATSSTPPSPNLSRTGSTSAFGGDFYHPPDRVTIFDLLENLALPHRLQSSFEGVSMPNQRIRRPRLKATGIMAKEKVDEWRKRIPGTSQDEMERYRKRVRDQMDRVSRRWNDSKTITMREKVSFIGGVLNIFVSGIMLGAFPEWFHVWYTAQLVYYLPIRAYTYHKRGYHYFLADLCYFVNFLLILSIWVFPNSRRLLISTFCLAFGNNAIAIAMWRNSLVFHSLEKITTVFIHIMPCVTLHCLVHLYPRDRLPARFPAVYTVRYAPHGDPNHYTLLGMIAWASVPYFFWQLNYHMFITVRRAAKIAAGRPTSFTWLRRSFANTWIGKFVLSLPDSLQEPAFMTIQYSYALLTMLPCPLWFWYPWLSATFLLSVFTWSVYNGATYYIDVFGQRFQKELEALRKEVERGQPTGDAGKAAGASASTETVPTLSKPAEDDGERKAEEPESVVSDFDPPGLSPAIPAIPAIPLSMEAAHAAVEDDIGPMGSAGSVENQPLLDGERLKQE